MWLKDRMMRDMMLTILEARRKVVAAALGEAVRLRQDLNATNEQRQEAEQALVEAREKLKGESHAKNEFGGGTV
jgi:F0F1-type ATP synthase membrane subunit b/b'